MSYPAPILNLNFANAKQLVHPALTFSRASLGSYFDGSGIMRYANNSVPRFDHDPLTGICRGLLVEPAVTFLDTYSEQFDNAAWSKSRTSITANAAVAPDGTTTADKLVEDTTATATHFTQKSVTPYSESITASVFVKAAERSYCRIQLSNVTDDGRVDVNLSDGSSLNVTVSKGFPSGITVSTKMVGNGWYYLTIGGTLSAISSISFQIYVGTTTDFAYTGDGTSGIYIWGAKIYAGTGPTSYLPTVASGVTRAADVCSVDLTKLTRNGSPLWAGTEGTIVVDATMPNPNGQYQFLAVIDDGTPYNRFALVIFPSGYLYAETHISGVATASISVSSLISPGQRVKIAFALKQFDKAVSLNGAAIVTFAGDLYTSATRMLIGYQINCCIKSVQLYNRRIADAYLPALSAL